MLNEWRRTHRRDRNVCCGDTVKILVGTPAKVFYVHETVLRQNPEFFDKALTGQWEEACMRVAHLPEDDPQIFAIFVHWIYSAELPTNADALCGDNNSEYMELAKAYILRDKMLSLAFQDRAIDGMVNKCTAKRQVFDELLLEMDVV
ncbi:hypothetical protein BDW74DRAFT_179054 [Aspergillus multicolor]|uniref:BTB/POZ domain-containing protein n=1 Tax=Aspergillus multicolor TaxID=41759 RepID=UPI003CCC9822